MARWPVHDPAESCQKVLKACQSLLRNTFSTLFACKNNTAKEKGAAMLKGSPSSKTLLGSAGYQTQGNNFRIRISP